jgi:hypothetical protein
MARSRSLRGGIRRVQERLRLLDGKPIAHSHALHLDALDARDPGCQLGRQQPVVRGFDGQLAHRGDSHVDRNRSEPAGLQGNPPRADRRLREARARLLAEPREEFVKPEIVDPFRNRGRNAVQNERLELVPLVGLRNDNQVSHLGLLNGQYR